MSLTRKIERLFQNRQWSQWFAPLFFPIGTPVWENGSGPFMGFVSVPCRHLLRLSSRTTDERKETIPLENLKLVKPDFGNQRMSDLDSASQTTSQSDESEHKDPEPITLIGKRVVIIEDEGITQMQLNRLLRQAGLEIVGVAGDGIAGTEVVLRERPDLVLMDIRMPRRDGIEATEQILAVYPVCIVMLTAYADESLQEKARLAGASGYLIKPITGLTLIPQLLTAYQQFRNQ